MSFSPNYISLPQQLMKKKTSGFGNFKNFRSQTRQNFQPVWYPSYPPNRRSRKLKHSMDTKNHVQQRSCSKKSIAVRSACRTHCRSVDTKVRRSTQCPTCFTTSDRNCRNNWFKSCRKMCRIIPRSISTRPCLNIRLTKVHPIFF